MISPAKRLGEDRAAGRTAVKSQRLTAGLADELKAKRSAEELNKKTLARTAKIYIAQRRAEELKEEARLGSEALKRAESARVSVSERPAAKPAAPPFVKPFITPFSPPPRKTP